MVQERIQAVVTMLAVINPAVTGMILLQITPGEARSGKLKEASRSSVTVFIILLVTALLGKYILRLFGISIESFRIVGGIVIAYIGFTMLAGKMPRQSLDQPKKDSDKIDNSPLVMFPASPGTIATLTTISVKEGSTHISDRSHYCSNGQYVCHLACTCPDVSVSTEKVFKYFIYPTVHGVDSYCDGAAVRDGGI